jgi:hypothetical protein
MPRRLADIFFPRDYRSRTTALVVSRPAIIVVNCALLAPIFASLLILSHKKRRSPQLAHQITKRPACRPRLRIV